MKYRDFDDMGRYDCAHPCRCHDAITMRSHIISVALLSVAILTTTACAMVRDTVGTALSMDAGYTLTITESLTSAAVVGSTHTLTMASGRQSFAIDGQDANTFNMPYKDGFYVLDSRNWQGLVSSRIDANFTSYTSQCTGPNGVVLWRVAGTLTKAGYAMKPGDPL